MTSTSRRKSLRKLVRRWSTARQNGDEHGASLVEFALILPVFALMLFGMIQFGLAFTGWDQLRNSVQTGARMAAMDDLGSGTTGCTPPSGYSANTQDLVCEIESVIGAPSGTTGNPAVAVYFTDPTLPSQPTEVVVCARTQAQVFTGFFPTVNLTATSEFYIDHFDSLLQDYNPTGLDPSTCGSQTP
jgi:Flp pilus assembly pilin Flp